MQGKVLAVAEDLEMRETMRCGAPVLEVASLVAERAALVSDAARRAAAYLESLAERTVAPSAQAVAELTKLDVPFPDRPAGGHETLRVLDQIGSPATVASAGPRYFGFVVGGALPVSVAANWLATAWDQNASMRALAPGACAFEDVAARWVVEALGLPAATHCTLTTGTTTADIVALVAARHAVLERHGWDVEANGLAGSPPIRIVVGEEVHATMYRALTVVGFGRDQVVRVPVDEQGRIRAGMLPSIEGPAIVCLQAGNVNTGAFDPIREICERVRPAGAWVHLDGAFGLWAAASPRLRHLVDGMELVDSCATDAHKWLNTPYDCGLALVRDVAPLQRALSMSAGYLIQSGDDPMNTSLEGSRRARGIELWAALHSMGREGLRALVEKCCRQARRFAETLQTSGYAVLNETVLNQVLVSFGDDATTRQVIDALQRDGTCWCGGTTWRGRAAMRISVSSWATTDADVERSLEAILHIASQTCS